MALSLDRPPPPAALRDLVLVDAKLTPPASRAGQIFRDALVARLDAARESRLVLVSALAGFGKTTLLGQWARSTARPTAWVSLDADDRDPHVGWMYITAGLDRILPGVAQGVIGPLRAGASIEKVVLPRLLNALEGQACPFALVLDDFHEAASFEMEETMGLFVARMPPGAQVVVSTRRDPLLPLARWRAQGEVVEFRQSDLSFRDSEARALVVDHLGVRLSEESLARLMGDTLGWPAMLYLAALAVQERGDPDTAVDAFTGDQRTMASYCAEEVLGAWPEETRLLMRWTAVFDRFCGPLLEDAAHLHAPADVLHRWEHENLLLAPLDDRGEWYRFHPVLRDLLLAELRQEAPATAVELLRRGALWHEARGDVADAMRYAADSGDWDLTATLLNRHWEVLLDTGQGRILHGVLAKLPARESARDPRVLVVEAWTSALAGDWSLAEAAMDAAMLVDPAMVLPDGSPSVDAAAAMLRSSFPQAGTGTMARNAHRALELLPEESPLRAIPLLGLAFAALLEGDLTQSREQFLASMATVATPARRVIATSYLALIAIEQEDLAGAEALARAAEATAERYGVDGAPALSVLATSRGALLCAQGDAHAGVVQLERAVKLSVPRRTIEHLEPVLRLAAAYAASGNAAQAQPLLADATGILSSWGDAGERYRGILRALEALAGRGGDPVLRGPWGDTLSHAELRVFHMLSTTHLSQGDIAARLFISVNTVKSHVRSIYRKLDVSTREEAARVAGQGLSGLVLHVPTPV